MFHFIHLTSPTKLKAMYKIYTTLLAICFSINIYAQDTLFSYYDAKWNETTKEQAKYYRHAFAQPDSVFLVHDFYMNGQMQMDGAYIGKKMKLKQGHFKYYNKDGTLTSDLYFENDTAHGTFLLYYDNGNLSMSTNRTHDTLDGETKYFFENGQLASEGTFIKGMRRGEWKYYDKYGKFQGSEYFYASFETPCNFIINFKEDRWVNFKQEHQGEKRGDLTFDEFIRKGTSTKSGKNALFLMTACCIRKLPDEELKARTIAENFLSTQGVKAVEVKKYKGVERELKGGLLYTYNYKNSGNKRTCYLYVKKEEKNAIELFFEYDSKMDEQYIKDIFDIIEDLD
jgi:antitoxin component YwqK of YwqJK toxin-antitoxin module